MLTEDLAFYCSACIDGHDRSSSPSPLSPSHSRRDVGPRCSTPRLQQCPVGGTIGAAQRRIAWHSDSTLKPRRGLSVGVGLKPSVLGKKALLRTGKVPLLELYLKGSLTVRVERKDEFPFVGMVSYLLDLHV